MSKILDLVGLGLIGGTIVSFIPGLIPNLEGGLNPVFWGCALGALAISFIERNKERNKIKIYRNRSIAQSKLYRQIYKGPERQIFGEYGR